MDEIRRHPDPRGRREATATTVPAQRGKVGDIMTPAPVGVYYSQTIGETARIMRDTQVGAVLVVNDGALSGVVTDRDLVVRGLAEGEGPSPRWARCAAATWLASPPTRTSPRPRSSCASTPSAGCRSSATGRSSASCPWATSRSPRTRTRRWPRSAAPSRHDLTCNQADAPGRVAGPGLGTFLASGVKRHVAGSGLSPRPREAP